MEAHSCHCGHNLIIWCYLWALIVVSLQVFENASSPNGEDLPLWRHVLVTLVIVFDSRQKGPRFKPHRRHCVVVLEQDTFILA